MNIVIYVIYFILFWTKFYFGINTSFFAKINEYQQSE